MKVIFQRKTGNNDLINGTRNNGLRKSKIILSDIVSPLRYRFVRCSEIMSTIQWATSSWNNWKWFNQTVNKKYSAISIFTYSNVYHNSLIYKSKRKQNKYKNWRVW